jgi:hypothetical protein
MSEVAEILKVAHELIKDGDKAKVQVDKNNLGMAYAIPFGSEKTVVNDYSPWKKATLRQVFYDRDAIFGGTISEIWLYLEWKCSQSGQYIIEVFLDPVIKYETSVASSSMDVRFSQPVMFDKEYEAWEISFDAFVNLFSPEGRVNAKYSGTIRADGTGEFLII